MYLALKLLHILAVTLFLGNIITGLFWKAHADRSADPRIMAHTLEGIIRSDRWFTLPGVLLIVLFGVAAAIVGQLPLLRTPWIRQAIILFTLSGLAFGLQVAPLQRRLLALARTAANGGAWDAERYRSLSRRWEWWGVFAILTPVGALALMVVKPAHSGEFPPHQTPNHRMKLTSSAIGLRGSMRLRSSARSLARTSLGAQRMRGR
ncbi:MAG TPA: DUF2269 domain-containing protein [Gemmatimonadales bacterium]|nr:DUF2269 domain-containing protein [Gemmatimonadales bacterium]